MLRGHAVFELDGNQVDGAGPEAVSSSPLPAPSDRPPPRSQGRPSSWWSEAAPGKAYEARGWELWAPLSSPCTRRASTPRSPTASAPWSRTRRGLPHAVLQQPRLLREPLRPDERSALDHLRHGPSRCRRSSTTTRRGQRPGSDPRTNPRSSNWSATRSRNGPSRARMRQIVPAQVLVVVPDGGASHRQARRGHGRGLRAGEDEVRDGAGLDVGERRHVLSPHVGVAGPRSNVSTMGPVSSRGMNGSAPRVSGE